ncbi:helix-turn-helix transcriptional regulator [Nostoc sp. NIES-2111]
MSHYAVLRTRGANSPTLSHQLHNAPRGCCADFSDAGYWRSPPLFVSLIGGGPPVTFGTNQRLPAPARAPGFEEGSAAVALEPRGACILILARSGPPLIGTEQLQGHLLAMLGVTRLSDKLQHLDAVQCPLSRRQLECLRHAMAGHTATATARALGVGPRTVEQYLERARDVLGAPNTLSAAVRAIDRGWITTAEVYALMAAQDQLPVQGMPKSS